MKAIPSIAFGEFSGSAGDVTARSIGGRTLLNHKAYQSKVKTPAQAVSRNTLSKVSRAYKQLSDSQMKAWGALAEHLKGISTFGKAAEMTAHNAFVRINANRQLVGMPLLVDAPEYRSDVPEVDYEDFWVCPDFIMFIGIEKPKESYKLVVKMSACLGNGISSGWSKTVIVSPGMDEDWGDADITKFYTKTIGYTKKRQVCYQYGNPLEILAYCGSPGMAVADLDRRRLLRLPEIHRHVERADFVEFHNVQHPESDAVDE